MNRCARLPRAMRQPLRCVSRKATGCVGPRSAFLTSTPRPSPVFLCQLSTAPARRVDGRELEGGGRGASNYEDGVATDKRVRTAWHRQGSDRPPVRRPRSAGAMTKGKLLTTPSRLLKLILPLTTHDRNSDRKDIEPLALVVHPQQPLSYLERLIQSELPTIRSKDGKEIIPAVYFKAEDSGQSQLGAASERHDEDHMERTKISGQVEKTGVLNRKGKSKDDASHERSGQARVESYSGEGREASKDDDSDGNFVRWSGSTEIGDFIRDAARGREFAVAIEGAPNEIRVGVPSFNDRTHYLRQRLRRTSHRIRDMAAVKSECDRIAHNSARRVALTGFGALVSWWCGVYYLTFQTNLGWYHNREVSYRAALNLTISRRQTKLYQAKGFDLEQWEALIKDGSDLRREIKAIATEYDVEWDEKQDEQDETVKEALKKKEKEEDSGDSRDEDGKKDA